MVIILRLSSSIQGYSISSCHSNKPTVRDVPKSSVLNMIACCMGWNTKEKPKDITWEEMTRLPMNLRVEREGIIETDFQVATNVPLRNTKKIWNFCGEDIIDPFFPHYGDGKTELSKKSYLSDAEFIVTLEGEKKLVERISESLCDPVWIPYLGRSNCIPSRPIFENLIDGNGTEVIEKYPYYRRKGSNELIKNIRVIYETSPRDTKGSLIYDVPMSVGCCKNSGVMPRCIRNGFINVQNLEIKEY